MLSKVGLFYEGAELVIVLSTVEVAFVAWQ